MAKTTHAITHRYVVNGQTLEITRRHVRTAYAANGNVGNPTEYFVWDANLDGAHKATAGSRSDAYELALGHAVYVDGRYVGGRPEDVRNWRLVKAEMGETYVGRA